MKYLSTSLLLFFTLQSIAQVDLPNKDTIIYPYVALSLVDYSEETNWIDIYLKQDIHRPYSYSAKVTDIYDGDTFTLEFDLGFGLQYEDVIRLARVDTPEIKGKERPEGVKVRDKVEELILNKPVIAVTNQDDRGKYGRIIAEIYYQHDGFWVNLSEYLLKNAMAELYE